MKYFSNIPTIDYQYPDGKILTSKTIFIKPNIKLSGDVDPNTNKYVIQDGKSPDKISKEVYQNSDYFWSLLNTNNIVDFYKEWPVSYSAWEEEQYKVNSEFTIYSKYVMPVKVGDLVCKYLAGERINFDNTNYGVISAYNSFYRSFDINPIAGQIKKNDSIIILRKNGRGYSIVKTPDNRETQVVIKIVQKLESAFQFQKKDSYSGYYGAVSPYYTTTGEVIDDAVSDLSAYTNTVLWKYMNDILENEYKMVTFKQNQENEWTFRRNITVVPKVKLSQVITTAIQSIERQKVAFE